MDNKACNLQDAEVRKGPWTVEEDMILINHISNNGRGVWNSLARSSGLRRSGKSCRLRWLNYLRPGVKRGNITADEELLIMELHEKLGNSWSKIAKHLPGRTDNEVKNYWRTRIQKRMNQSHHDEHKSDDQHHHDEHKYDDQHHHFQATTSGAAGEAEPYNILPSYPNNNINVQNSSTCDPTTTTDSYDNFWCLDDLWPSYPPNFDT